MAAMSIVRVGLAETKNYADGWEAIFGKGKNKKKTPSKNAKSASASARKTGKKATAKSRKKGR